MLGGAARAARSLGIKKNPASVKFRDMSKSMYKCSGNIKPVIQPYSRAGAPKQTVKGFHPEMTNESQPQCDCSRNFGPVCSSRFRGIDERHCSVRRRWSKRQRKW